MKKEESAVEKAAVEHKKVEKQPAHQVEAAPERKELAKTAHRPPKKAAHAVEKEGPAIPGVLFTEKLIEVLDHELNGRVLGWRPNDIILGKITDNVKQFQLGALEAIRFTTIRLKESFTRFGDADAYDPHLIQAVNLLMNKADQFWFPSAESQYESAIEELKKFLANLRQGKSRFYYRVENLSSLVAAYKDLLGNCHENLVKEFEADGSQVSFFASDDYFYYAQGVAHVMVEILGAVRMSFVEQLRTIDALDLMDKIIEELERAVDIHPWIVLNSSPGSILANQRYNLAAPISAALHGMGIMLKY
ncbi:MAG: DUF2333 family protein [Deltaproteobacteria bacterium]|nr:DUF2333 family protein [Deltaproteobacteria bacterium]